MSVLSDNAALLCNSDVKETSVSYRVIKLCLVIWQYLSPQNLMQYSIIVSYFVCVRSVLYIQYRFVELGKMPRVTHSLF